MSGGARDAGRTVLDRALAILGAFSDARPEQSLAAICAATGLPSATTHRLVAQLVEWGALERVARGRYRVGLRLWRLGSLAPAARDLRDSALPVMQDLAAATGHLVHLVVLDGTGPDVDALFLERLAGHSAVRVRSQVGRRLPVHASGPGKVLLAHADPAVVDAVLARGLPRVASGTITDPARFRRALADVRHAGYCLSRDEMTEGTSSVAAPITGAAGRVVASLSLVVPSTVGNLAPLVPAVRVAAAGVSRSLR